jgi:hypothetical protein
LVDLSRKVEQAELFKSTVDPNMGSTCSCHFPEAEPELAVHVETAGNKNIDLRRRIGTLLFDSPRSAILPNKEFRDAHVPWQNPSLL